MASTVSNVSTVFTNIIEGLSATGNATAIPSVLSSLTSLFVHTPSGVVDISKKTIDVVWAQANPTLVPLYMAQGYTIVP